MNARPTLLSAILALVVIILTGPMLLLRTVDDESCPDPRNPVETRPCYEQLTDSNFHKRVVAAGIAGIADPWQELAGGLLTLFGFPAFMSAVARTKVEQPAEEEEEESEA